MAGGLSIPSIGAVFAGAAAAARRFPLTLACGCLWCLVKVAENHRWHPLGSASRTDQAEIYLLLGFFWSLAATLIGESRGWRGPKTTGLAAVGLLVLLWPVGIYGGGWTISLNPLFYFLLPGLVLLTITAPFLRAGSATLALWHFNRVSWLAAAFGILVAVLACLGLMALLQGLETLFGLEIESRAYTDIWLVGFGLLAPWLTLCGLPRQFAGSDRDEVPRWVTFLASFLLVPLVTIYLLLIYLYIGKIVLAWELPRGEVAWIISGFAVAGVLTQLFSYPLAATGRAWIKTFQRHFYHALWPPTVLLWIAVASRIQSYGVTESRYLLALFAAWLTLLCLAFTLRKAPLILVPLSLAALLIMAAVGPWGAAQVSGRSQLSELTALLDRHDLVRDGRLAAATEDPPFADRKRISSIVRYLDHSGKQALLAPLLTHSDVASKSQNWTQRVLRSLNIELISKWDVEGKFRFGARRDRLLEITGYDLLIDDGFNTSSAWSYTLAGDTRFTVALDPDRRHLTVTDSHGDILRFDVGALVDHLRSDPSRFEDADRVPQEAMTLETETPDLKARIQFHQLSGRAGQVAMGSFKLFLTRR